MDGSLEPSVAGPDLLHLMYFTVEEVHIPGGLAICWNTKVRSYDPSCLKIALWALQ